MKGVYRIVDANINRVCEGLRVIEDIFRFSYNDKNTVEKIRELRHTIRIIFSNIYPDLIHNRDSVKDVGVPISLTKNDDDRKNLADTVLANFKRVQEALRVIEENIKILGFYENSKKIEQIRFQIYGLEKISRLMLHKKIIPTGIYGITASNFSNGLSNVECVKQMVKAGVKIIQYREKYLSLKEKLAEAKEIRKITKDSEVIFIVNDNVDIALMTDADGIHIGQDDYDVKDVRDLIGGDKIIGLSTHSPQQAHQAVIDKADYIGVGPIFETKTKDDVCAAVGISYLDYVVKNIELPFVAIGGIKLHNIDGIISCGAKRVALVTEIVGSKNIAETIKKIDEKFLKGEKR